MHSEWVEGNRLTTQHWSEQRISRWHEFGTFADIPILFVRLEVCRFNL